VLPGTLPGAAWRNLTRLQSLLVNDNALTGKLPPELAATSPRLSTLLLHHNGFTGASKACSNACRTAHCTEESVARCLRRAGTLPPEYGRLVNLTFLSARDNGLSGAHGVTGWLHAHCSCWLICWLANHAQARTASVSLCRSHPGYADELGGV